MNGLRKRKKLTFNFLLQRANNEMFSIAEKLYSIMYHCKCSRGEALLFFLSNPGNIIIFLIEIHCFGLCVQ